MGEAISEPSDFRLTKLHIAVIQNKIETVKRLLRVKDFDVDCRAVFGITPLMLAAAFGHLDVVCVLIKAGAMLEARDTIGRTAKKFSISSSTFVTNCWNAFEDIAPKLKGTCQAPEVQFRRRQIFNILRRQDTFHGFLMGEAQPHGSSFFRPSPDGGWEVLRCYASAANGCNYKKKTPACIVRNGKASIMRWAFSGWTSSDVHPRVVNNHQYTQLVMRFCRSSGFSLSGNARDNPAGRITDAGLVETQKGKWQACHAEKKLGLWYLRFLLTKFLKQRFDDEFNREQLERFKAIRIPDRLRIAYIFLGHDPCSGCLNFLNHIKEISGLEIWVKPIRILREHQRSEGENPKYTPSSNQQNDGDHSNDDSQETLPSTTPKKQGTVDFRRPISPQYPGNGRHPTWGAKQKPGVPTPVLQPPWIL